MSRTGFVVSTHDTIAVVSSQRRGVCAECTDKDSCGLLTADGAEAADVLDARNDIGAREGDFVEFDLPGRGELRLSMLVWALPIAGMLLGALLGDAFHQPLDLTSDGGVALGGILGVVLFFLPAIIYDRVVLKKARYLPVVTRVVTPTACDRSARNR